MKRFFPNYISYAIQLLDRYSQFITTKDCIKILVIHNIWDNINALRNKFIMLQDKEDLTEDDQIYRNLKNFRQLLLELEELECFALPIITHYQKEFDGYLSNVLQQICHEIGCPVDPPHVCALSTGSINQGRDYYWYHSGYETIFLPAVERFSWLNLPDLIHELGHHLLKVYRLSFVEPFSEWFKECQAELEREVFITDIQDTNRIRESRKVFPYRWLYWAEEIVCDLIAAYCLGQAFAWTNLKLSQHLPFDMSYGIYDYSETHPADACRMEAILLMLKKLGIPGEEVKKTWSNYIDIFYPNKQPLYDFYFPNKLVEKIVTHVFQACDDVGLISCTKNHNKETTIVWKLQQTWLFFQTDQARLKEIEEIPFILNA